MHKINVTNNNVLQKNMEQEDTINLNSTDSASKVSVTSAVTKS